MFFTTLATVGNARITKNLGFIYECSSHTRPLNEDLKTALRIISGKSSDEIENSYKALLGETMEKIKQRASEVGANALVGMKVESNFMADGTSVVYIYGDLVVIEDDNDN